MMMLQSIDLIRLGAMATIIRDYLNSNMLDGFDVDWVSRAPIDGS